MFFQSTSEHSPSLETPGFQRLKERIVGLDLAGPLPWHAVAFTWSLVIFCTSLDGGLLWNEELLKLSLIAWPSVCRET